MDLNDARLCRFKTHSSSALLQDNPFPRYNNLRTAVEPWELDDQASRPQWAYTHVPTVIEILRQNSIGMQVSIVPVSGVKFWIGLVFLVLLRRGPRFCTLYVYKWFFLLLLVVALRVYTAPKV